jgi:hypothetical protein
VCIAVTALRKTAQLYEKLSPDAAWFIYNRAHMDDALPGDDNLEKLTIICHSLDTSWI